MICISKKVNLTQLLQLEKNVFAHGRFHRDFNISKNKANTRYDNWLKQLFEAQQVYGLFWSRELAGFIAYHENCLVLHMLRTSYRGRRLSRYWWSLVCLEQFNAGCKTIKSSISATNIPVLNLYASLGFSFSKAQDVYHCLVH